MSEYQYYEFIAIDRPLTAEQIATVERVSSRADVSSTRFVNIYNYGDFNGDVYEFLRDHYDAMVHVANWGTRQFAFRVPKDLVDAAALKAYERENFLTVRSAGERWIVDLNFQPQDGSDAEEVDGDGLLSSLSAIRSEVLSGDLRPLLIGWLAAIQEFGPGRDDDDEWAAAADEDPVPPIPPGMKKLTVAQRALVKFFEVDPALLDLVSVNSEPPLPEPELDGLLKKFPTDQKERWLLELLTTDDRLAAARIVRQIRPPRKTPAAASPYKSVGELRRAWGDLVRKKAAQRDRAAAAARELELDRLAARGDSVWIEVESLIGMRNGEAYKQAVELLKNLDAALSRPGRDLAGFKIRVNRLITSHSRKVQFIELARKSGIA